jgi:hypothetical protein
MPPANAGRSAPRNSNLGRDRVLQQRGPAELRDVSVGVCGKRLPDVCGFAGKQLPGIQRAFHQH